MAITITDSQMSSDTNAALLVRLPDSDLWGIASYPVDARFLHPERIFTHDQATTAMVYAEHLASHDPDITPDNSPGTSSHHCEHLATWTNQLLAAPHLNTEPAGTPTYALCCLYCGSPDDIHEVLVTIDERTSEYALQCGLCDGVWAS